MRKLIKAISILVILIVVAIFGLIYFIKPGGLNTSRLITKAARQQKETQEIAKRALAEGKSFSETLKVVLEASQSKRNQREEWRDMVCARSAARKLDRLTVMGRVDSREAVIFSTEGVKSWEELLKKEKIQNDMSLVWLQNIIFDLASMEAFSVPIPKVVQLQANELKVYSNYSYILCKRGTNPTWAAGCTELQQIYHEPEKFIEKMRAYWDLVKNDKC